nr:reverse transcriptase domain-containing protein [Tanacetum cinerariifolium]
MNKVNMKAMQTQIDMVKNELRNEMKTSIQTFLSNQTNEIKNMMASLFQMNTASGSRSLPSNIILNPKGKLKAITTRSGLVTDGPTIPTPPKSITLEVDERVEETYTDPNLAEYTIKVPPPPAQKYKPPSQREFLCIKGILKMIKALLSNKEKLQELTNTPLNENCLAVILKKLPKKLGDPEKFLIPCGFSELKCKALANLGASINLMPLSVWKKLGLPELIPTRMTLELAKRAICTPVGIARDVFVPVGKFTFPADFVIVDYESDPRVPFILGRPFLRTAHALIDVHGEDMILRDGDERLTLNMRHETEDYLEDLFPKRPSGNPTFLPHPELTTPEVTNDIFISEGCNVLSKKLPDLDSTKDLHPYFHDNPLSCSTTYSFSSNSSLEEFTDELALITYPPEYDDNLQFDIESDLKEIELLLYQDTDSSLKDLINQKGLANLDAIFVDPIPEMFTDEHTPDYSSPLIFDEEKIKESKLLIDELDLPCDLLLPFEYDLFNSQDFSRVDGLPSTNDEDKVFNPGILIHEKPKIITRVIQDKKLAISNAFLVLEDFDPPFYEPIFFKVVPKSKMLLLFSSKSEEKVFKPGVHTFEKVHSYFIQELSYPGYHVLKINQIFKSLMDIFSCLLWKEHAYLGYSSFPFLSPLTSSSMGNWVKLSDLK